MLHSLDLGLFLAALAGVSTAQNCPFLGPAYPPATSADAPAFVSASSAFDKGLADALSSVKVSGATTSFAIQVYSASAKKPIYASYHTPTIVSNGTKATNVDPDTILRDHSISKLLTVYTILTKLGDKYWDEPVAKFVSEIAHLSGGNPVYDADWREVTLGSLASFMSGVGRDYALADLSVGNNASALPGARQLADFEAVKCGAAGLKPCMRAESIRAMLILLAYAVENITSTPFPDLVEQRLINPLKLSRTLVATPTNLTSDFVRAAGWDQDFGDESPTAGYSLSASDLSTIKSLALEIWLAAGEQAARGEAGKTFAARYTQGPNSTVEISLLPNEPGLFVGKFVSSGTDMFAQFGKLAGRSPSEKLGAWLYPMRLEGRAFSGTEVAFKATLGAVRTPAREYCMSWASVDSMRYGGYPADLALFGVGRGGQVSSVSWPLISERSFRKEGQTGDGIFGPFEPELLHVARARLGGRRRQVSKQASVVR